MPKVKLILASASPRRAELLRDVGVAFSVVVSEAREPSRKPAGIPVELWPACLAYIKASAVQRQIARRPAYKNAIILGADTIVVDGMPPHERILNKAHHRGHARRMLRSLQNKTHRVITGIALLRGEQVRLSFAEATCRVNAFTPAFLERYLDSGLWRGKAGAYGIQDKHDPFVHLLKGDFSTVVGLPVPLVLSELSALLKDRS